MHGLKNKLIETKIHLEQIIREVQNNLAHAPEGTLRVSRSRTNPQFYHQFFDDKEEKQASIYIAKNNLDLAKQLAQKDYDEKVLALAEKRIAQIDRILKDYEDEELESIFLNCHPARKELIMPIEPTWDDVVKKWMDQPYKGKPFQEGLQEIFSDRGERMRSKSEKIIADYLAHHHILYKYECPLNLDGYGIIYPDFTILSKHLRKTIIWEHFGRMDDPNYVKNAIKKIELYEANGYFLGERLIVTLETAHYILNTKVIERQARRFLL